MDFKKLDKKQKFLYAIMVEYDKAAVNFPDFHSYHEGYAVIKEELDELWDEIKKKNQIPANMKNEAIQTASMCLRFLIDCIE